jgi:hypothetical protein
MPVSVSRHVYDTAAGGGADGGRGTRQLQATYACLRPCCAPREGAQQLGRRRQRQQSAGKAANADQRFGVGPVGVGRRLCAARVSARALVSPWRGAANVRDAGCKEETSSVFKGEL